MNYTVVNSISDEELGVLDENLNVLSGDHLRDFMDTVPEELPLRLGVTEGDRHETYHHMRQRGRPGYFSAFIDHIHQNNLYMRKAE